MTRTKTPLLLLLLGGTLLAQPTPSERRPAPDPVRVAAVDVDLTVRGPVLEARYRIELQNPTGSDAEHDFLFPLPRGAVLRDVELRQGDEVLEASVVPAETARAVWRDLLSRHRDPALLEHYGLGLIRARVFPVPAKGGCELRLTVSRLLDGARPLTMVHLPLRAFCRHGASPRLTLKGEIWSRQPLATLHCPTHALGSTRLDEVSEDGFTHRARFEVEGTDALVRQDFRLLFRRGQSDGLVDVTVLSERIGSEDGYFVALIDGHPQDATATEPRDLVLVLDRSGSMKGKKIEQARAAAAYIIERLRPQDRFSVVSYSTDVRRFRDGLVPATPSAITEALAFVNGTEADGGTNIGEALEAALGAFEKTERARQVLFLTDGLPTVGEQNPMKLARLAREKNGSEARIIAFGVGHDVNGPLLDRLAVESRGLSDFVLPTENIEERVPEFYATMQSPLVLDLEIRIEASAQAAPLVHDVHPRMHGDLYGGRQLMIVGRYTRPGPARMVLSGRRRGRSFERSFDFDLAERTATPQGLIPRLWAAKKVGYLVDEIRLNGSRKELVDEIVRLGRRWGILTEYTSFLAAPQTELADTDANRRKAAEELAARAGVASGSHGVAQSANSKVLQRNKAADGRIAWLNEQGRLTEVTTCRQVGARTFFRRGEAWVDSELPAEIEDAEVEKVVLFSDAFFDLIEREPQLRELIARTGECRLVLGERVFHFVPAP